MESKQGRVFVGGIPWETTEERLKDYFKTFGDLVEVVIMKDKFTGRSRGFGFLDFADPTVAERLLLDSKHNIDGRIVEVRKAISRDEQNNKNRSRDLTHGYGAQNQSRTKKIFVGGLPPTVTENDLREYFNQFGTITHAVVMYDPITQSSRGFGFITFDSEDTVDIVVQTPFYELNGKMVEVKRSVPKELSSGHGRFPVGRGGNFSFSNAHGFNSTPIPSAGYFPAMNTGYSAAVNTGYSAAVGETSTYSSYGPAGYNVSSYGTAAGYGPAITGNGYGNTSFVNNIPSYGPSTGSIYGPSTGSIYGGAPNSSGGPVAYGVDTAGNGGLYGNGATPTPGSSMGGAPAMPYGNTGSFVGYEDPGSRGINPYGAGQVDNGQSNGNNAGYAAQNNVFEMGVTPYGSASVGYGDA